MNNILKRNNVNITGEGDQFIIFAHGFGCSQNAWKRITPAFIAEYKVVLFDYVGSGNADISAYDKEKYGSLEGYATDISEICAALNIKNAVFVGHSVSCMIGALAAIKDPSLFKKLIFVAPSPYYLNEGGYEGGFEKEEIDTLFELMEEDYERWAKLISPQIMANPENPELASEMESNFCSTDNEVVKQFARITFLSDNRKDLPHIPVPSVTLQCADDIIAPLSVGQYIKDHTPENTLVNMEATGHCPHISAPEETIKVIKSFL